MTNKTPKSELSLETLDAFRAEYDLDPKNRLMQNAVTLHDIDEIALDRQIVTNATHFYSTKLDDWQPTDQGDSGRCWLFSGLNLCRIDAMKSLNVNDFEFSQSYLMFWDKIERTNFLLESVIQTSDRAVDDRTIQYLMQAPIEDAGQWDMFVNLVTKHGVVPKSAMPETQSSGATNKMNSILYYQVRQGAMKIREMYKIEAGLDAMRQSKIETLEIVYKILCIHLGTPPKSFDWQWNDRNGTFRQDHAISPKQFADKYLPGNLDEFVCLVNDPREDHPYGLTYTIEHLGNVVDGRAVKYLNLPIDEIKDLTIRQLLDGRPVWMGCDTSKQNHRNLGIWDAKLFDYESLYGSKFNMNKAMRLEYGQTAMTHAMVFTGVDVENGKPRKWRVENSYGKTVGDNGFYLMNDSWFDEYMFEIAAPKNYLTPERLAEFKNEPIVLPPWDPMGALA